MVFFDREMVFFDRKMRVLGCFWLENGVFEVFLIYNDGVFEVFLVRKWCFEVFMV
jgi:hypothetical protein